MTHPPLPISYHYSLSSTTNNSYDSLVGRLLLHGVGEACVTRKKEMVYAGPDGGIAQVNHSPPFSLFHRIRPPESTC